MDASAARQGLPVVIRAAPPGRPDLLGRAGVLVAPVPASPDCWHVRVSETLEMAVVLIDDLDDATPAGPLAGWCPAPTQTNRQWLNGGRLDTAPAAEVLSDLLAEDEELPADPPPQDIFGGVVGRRRASSETFRSSSSRPNFSDLPRDRRPPDPFATETAAVRRLRVRMESAAARVNDLCAAVVLAEADVEAAARTLDDKRRELDGLRARRAELEVRLRQAEEAYAAAREGRRPVRVQAPASTPATPAAAVPSRPVVGGEVRRLDL